MGKLLRDVVAAATLLSFGATEGKPVSSREHDLLIRQDPFNIINNVLPSVGISLGPTVGISIGTSQAAGISPLLKGSYIGCLASGLFSTEFEPVQSPLQTQELCQSTCALFKFFAIQNGNTCFCDNSFAFGAIVPATATQPAGTGLLADASCNVKAAGNLAEAGGGINALTAFLNPVYVVRLNSLTLCLKLCSANGKLYHVR
ncbi:hypothetical protein M3J09_004693 [Ascochyta lentis]